MHEYTASIKFLAFQQDIPTYYCYQKIFQLFHNDNPEFASLIFAIADWFTLHASVSIFFINTWALMHQIQYIWEVRKGTEFSRVYFQNYTLNFHWPFTNHWSNMFSKKIVNFKGHWTANVKRTIGKKLHVKKSSILDIPASTSDCLYENGLIRNSITVS